MNHLLSYLEGEPIPSHKRLQICDTLKTFPDEKQIRLKQKTLEFDYKDYIMNDFRDRLETFKLVNNYYPHEDYARAGFYLNQDYNLVCFACQSILHNLPNKTIDPYKLHILFIEKCDWMEKILDKKYIDDSRIFYATHYKWLLDKYYDINEDATVSLTLLQSIPLHCKLYIEAHPHLIDYMDFVFSKEKTHFDCDTFYGLQKIA